MAKKKASLTDIPKDPLAELKKATEQRKAETPTVQTEKKPEKTEPRGNPAGKKEPTKNLNARVPVSAIRDIKLYCAEHGMSIQEFVNRAIAKMLAS